MSNRKGFIISDPFAMYFLTFTIVGWVDLFTRKEIRKIFINAIIHCQSHKGLILNAYVIMSSHVHLICSAKEGSKGLSPIIRDLKKYSSKQIIKYFLTDPSESRTDWLELIFRYHAKFNKNNQSFKVWQDLNHPKILLHPKFTIQKLKYIHNNPVKAGIVKHAEHYLYSSASNYLGIDNGILNVEIIDFGVQEGYVFT